MSSLLKPDGDDYPDAATKHLADAKALLGDSRFDGAAYLAGYVVECSLKSILQYETGNAPREHRLNRLANEVAKVTAIATAVTAKYLTPTVQNLPSTSIVGWSPEMRYRSASMSQTDADAWVGEADQFYSDTVASMILDGVIT